jgi:hypothetical protein
MWASSPVTSDAPAASARPVTPLDALADVVPRPEASVS